MTNRSFFNSFNSLLVTLGAGTLLVAASNGCNAQIATVLASEDAGGSSSQDDSSLPDAGALPNAGAAGDCAAGGGICLPEGQSAPPTHQMATADDGTCAEGQVCWLPIETTATSQVCSSDQDCNSEASISALHGKCFFGICQCNPGFYVQSNGKCAPTPQPSCLTHPSASCSSGETCPAGSLAGTGEMNMWCGDDTPAVCCTPKTACQGPVREAPGGQWESVELVCCTPKDGTKPPICVNGFQTCGAGLVPTLKEDGCGG